LTKNHGEIILISLKHFTHICNIVYPIKISNESKSVLVYILIQQEKWKYIMIKEILLDGMDVVRHLSRSNKESNYNV
jgi:hypothetical protein